MLMRSGIAKRKLLSVGSPPTIHSKEDFLLSNKGLFFCRTRSISSLSKGSTLFFNYLISW